MIKEHCLVVQQNNEWEDGISKGNRTKGKSIRLKPRGKEKKNCFATLREIRLDV